MVQKCAKAPKWRPCGRYRHTSVDARSRRIVGWGRQASTLFLPQFKVRIALFFPLRKLLPGDDRPRSAPKIQQKLYNSLHRGQRAGSAALSVTLGVMTPAKLAAHTRHAFVRAVGLRSTCTFRVYVLRTAAVKGHQLRRIPFSANPNRQKSGRIVRVDALWGQEGDQGWSHQV